MLVTSLFIFYLVNCFRLFRDKTDTSATRAYTRCNSRDRRVKSNKGMYITYLMHLGPTRSMDEAPSEGRCHRGILHE